MRGKACQLHGDLTLAGITPAYAGKSSCLLSPWVPTRDHPRVCGEKRACFMQDYDIRGSPPRMRGKAEEIAGKIPGAGITPAYAGKSAPVWSRCPGAWDHPRVCGEKLWRIALDAGQGGSPPRMRGKGLERQAASGQGGITPAYAGKRMQLDAGVLLKRDHPRVCGEKQIIDPSGSLNQGSPPRMRGKDLKSIEIQAPFFLCAQISFNF